jgi:Spy/CpxP family protein refolding chaperone
MKSAVRGFQGLDCCRNKRRRLMSKSLKALAAATVLALLALPVAAQTAAYDFDAQRPGPPTGSADYILTHPKLLSRYLGLSTAQDTQLQALWKTMTDAVATLRTARGPLCTQLRTDLAATPQSSTAVGTDAINLYNNKKQVAAARTTFDTAFSAILTADQRTKYNTLKQIAHLDNGVAGDPLGECPRASS